jgi:predicted nucleotidyltransferase
VPTLADAALTGQERALLERFSDTLAERLGPALHAVWLFGSRARGEAPGPDSDIDVLVLADDATWDGKLAVHFVLEDAARQLGLEDLAWSFSLHVDTPAWLAYRRAINSFFIAEVDRDKVVITGDG